MELETAARNNPDKKLKVPVDFIFDELEAVGSIPKFKETLDTIRYIGVNMTLCTQSLSQYDDLYGEKARISILNNCAKQILIGTADDEVTAKHFCNLGGKQTIYVETKDKDGNTTTHEQQLDLFPVDRALHLTEDEIFVYLQGRKGSLMLKPQHYWDNYPGSKAKIYNDYDGKTYHAHPLLEYREPVSMGDNIPLWQKMKKEAQKKPEANTSRTSKADVQYVFDEE
jgi:type IV secretion system protein VirD4